MKIYFAGIPGGVIKGEKNLTGKFKRIKRLLSFWNIINQEFGAFEIFQLLTKK